MFTIISILFFGPFGWFTNANLPAGFVMGSNGPIYTGVTNGYTNPVATVVLQNRGRKNDVR